MSLARTVRHGMTVSYFSIFTRLDYFYATPGLTTGSKFKFRFQTLFYGEGAVSKQKDPAVPRYTRRRHYVSLDDYFQLYRLFGTLQKASNIVHCSYSTNDSLRETK